MQFYPPVQRMINGGSINLDQLLESVLANVSPEVRSTVVEKINTGEIKRDDPDFINNIMNLARKNIDPQREILGQNVFDKGLGVDLSFLSNLFNKKEAEAKEVTDPTVSDPNVLIRNMDAFDTELRPFGGEEATLDMSGLEDITEAQKMRDSLESSKRVNDEVKDEVKEVNISEVGFDGKQKEVGSANPLFDAPLVKNSDNNLDPIEETGRYFGTDREEVIKAAGNLRESIAKQQERESNPDEVLTGFGRAMENLGDFTGITGESITTNIGDLRKELEQYYTDSPYEEAPRQTAARKEDREKIRVMIDNATPEQLFAMADEIKAGRGNVNAESVSLLMGGGPSMEEVKKKKPEPPPIEVAESVKKEVSEKSDVVTEDMEGTKSKTPPVPGRRGIPPESDLGQNIDDVSKAAGGNAVDLANKLKSAKDPEKFLDSLSGKDFLVIASAYLGTPNITAGTKAALTALLKSKEADKAHDLAVMRANSLDKYYQGSLKATRRGQDLTFKAQLAKLLDDNKIDKKEFADAVSKVRTAYKDKFGLPNKQGLMAKLKTTDKTLYNYFINNNIDPDTETIYRSIAAVDLGFLNLGGGLSSGSPKNSQLINKVTLREKG